MTAPAVTLRDGAKLSYIDKGRGQPILFIHAPGIGSINFSRQEPLAHKYRLLIPDLRGHGDSTPAREVFTIRDVADDLHDLIEALQLQDVVLCGYSQGACIALECLLSYPECFSGAILVGGYSEVNNLTLESEYWLAELLSNADTVPLFARGITGTHIADHEERKIWMEHFNKTDSQSLHRLYQAGHVFNCTERLREIQTPVLLLYGARDYSMHHYGEILRDHLPNSELRFVAGAKHQLVTHESEEFNRLIGEFVEERVLGRQSVELI
ncbi:alpha/beta fold hydrolase [Brevibacillus dissolubilis]|uniref:alpha/beta fold hydrolase n=1 Tax=Brevibacillus dissolubilis TaxID=1844116 RepID=UPI00159BC673|nr:alpha/beta hydrolase [Brevibacillus dissolubilis]